MRPTRFHTNASHQSENLCSFISNGKSESNVVSESSVSGLLFTCPGSECRTHLQSQPHSLGHGCLGEDGLHVGHQLAAQTAALWTNQVALLLDAGDHGEVEGEVGGDDPTDSLLLQLIVTLQVYTGRQ